MIKTFSKKYPKLFWMTVVVVLLPFISIGITEFVEDGSSRLVISNLYSLFYNLIATIALVIAAKASRRISKRLALGWGILAIALLSFTLGDIFWAFLKVGPKNTTFPSVAYGASLLFYPLYFIGITILPSKRLKTVEWLKRSLDICIVMIAAILVFWIFLIGPIIGSENTTSLLEKILTAAYPVGDLILLFGLLVIIYYRSEKFILGSIWILGLGLLAMIVTDSIFSYQSILGTYKSGGFLDLGWVIAKSLTALAAIYQAIASKTFKEEDTLPLKSVIIREKVSRVLAFLPYFWVVGAYLLLQTNYNSKFPINSTILFIGVGCVIGFVILRQIFALSEINLLLSRLKKSLDERNLQSAELNKTNQDLQQEITKRKSVEEQLLHDALHDGLTGLANRVLFMDRLGHAIEIAKREPEFHYSVLLLDVDNFKNINDSLGHVTGDQILIEIAQRLKNCVRSIDTVARYGGDEFVILLEHTVDNNAAILGADRILTEIQSPFIQKSKEVIITCSIGIVKGDSEYNNSEDILRDVDIALYKAKEMGKARSEVFTIDMRNSAMSKLEIESDLRLALTNSEFSLDYQPLYSLEKKNIIGVEALIRWHHPSHGLIMPTEFIHIAEESGSIIQIGDWVLREACCQLKKWHTEYPELDYLSMNVNISGKQVIQLDFVDKVKEILRVTGVNPKKLKLEITENAFIASQNLVNDSLSDLLKMGVDFVIDDFGIGYSSLAYLKNFSVKTIKIDKSFIDEIVDSDKGYEIIKTIILMTQGIGIDTVAEGIENIEQLQKLRTLNCIYGQGFYFSVPLEAKLIDKILSNQLDSSVS